MSAFLVMGISAYHLLRKQHVEFFVRSFRLALGIGLIFSLLEVVEGHLHGADLAEKQPTKLAAMEAHWQTSTEAPIYVFAIPDEKNERNVVEILPIPGLLSLLAKHDPKAEVKGLKAFPPADRPPVLISFIAFKLMIALGVYFALITVYGWVRRNRLVETPLLLKLMVLSIPLPYLAVEAGWVLAEVGRQPWIVYGLMRTSEASSLVAGSQVLISLVAFILVYGVLGCLGFYLMAKHAIRGPEPVRNQGPVTL